MYPRNAVSPERLAIGVVVQTSDGAVQTSGVAITVRPQGGAEATGLGTTVHGASGVVYYTPTQAETNFTSFIVIASKASCLPVVQTIITTASAVAGQVRLEGVTHTGAVIPTVSAVTGLTAANLDAAVSSRMATYTQPTGFLAATFPGTVASTTNITAATGVTLTATTGMGNQTANLTGNVSGSVGSVTGLTAANLDVAVSTRLATASYTAPTNLTAAQIATGVWQDAVAGDFTVANSVGKNVKNGDTVPGGASGIALVGSNVGSAASVTAAVTVGTLNANVITAASVNAAALDGKGNWNIGKTGYTLTQAFPTNFSALAITAGGLADITQAAADKAWATAARVLTAGTNIALAKGTGVTGFTDLSASQVENAVWDATNALHLGVGSTGAAQAAAGGAADPWTTALPGAYGAGTAGNIVGNRIDAAVSSRLATAGYTAPPSAATVADATWAKVLP